jgi:hypothetical protein
MARILAAALVAMSLVVSACHNPAPPLYPTRAVVEVAAVAKVAIKEIDVDIVEMTVWNNGNSPMVIDRDAIVLVTRTGPRTRLPGGIAHSYTVEPGAAREVNVRFDWRGLAPGDTVQIKLDTALTIFGKPIPIAPLEIVVR